MTKRKAPDQLLKRGPKQNTANDRHVWIAIQLRRRLRGFGRTSASSVKRAIDFLQQDTTGGLTSSRLGVRGLRDRFDRIEKRRKHDPAFAQELEQALAVHERICRRILLTPGSVIFHVDGGRPGS